MCPESSGDHIEEQHDANDFHSSDTGSKQHSPSRRLHQNHAQPASEQCRLHPDRSAYLVRYHDRENRSIQNGSNADWLKPAFAEAYRVLKQDRFMVSFYGWTQVDKFFDAWRSAGFRTIGHLVFRKQYTSNARFLQYQREQTYLRAKGNPALPEQAMADVIDMPTRATSCIPRKSRFQR